MQKKSCSNCSTQVFVAYKTCPSCQQPFPKTGPIAVIMSEYEGLFRRRTERIKREKPNYYDASVFSNRKNPKKTTTKKEREDKAGFKDKPDKSNKKSFPSSSSGKDNKKEKEPQYSPLPHPTASQSKDESKDSSPKPRRKKLMKTKVSKDTEEETYNSIMNTQQSARQCNIILAELNRKLFSTSWRGI